MSDEEKKVILVHVAGRRNDPATCPQTNEDGTCPNAECNRAETESGYGYAGGYGLGMYLYCPKCSTVYNFCADPG